MFSERRSEALARAYPRIEFRKHTRGLLARFMRAPAECAHLEADQAWMAAYAPDTLYLQGKARRAANARPEVSLCRACFTDALLPDLKAFGGPVVAFEPADAVTQYFFLAAEDFDAAGLLPQTAAAIERRLTAMARDCQRPGCSRAATWLWLSRESVGSLDEHERIAGAIGHDLCAAHGGEQMCRALTGLPEANLFYVNAPYGERGAYVWI